MSKANLFIVGTARAGTSFVSSLLASHNDILFCKIKEPNFFYRDYDINKIRNEFKAKFQDNLENILRGRLHQAHDALIETERTYSLLFDNFKSNKTYYAEASISYLHSNTASHHIKQYNENSRIIICIRDPLERLLSHVNMDYNNGLISSDLNKAIYLDMVSSHKGHYISNMYVELGYYFEAISRYIQLFGPNNVLVLELEKLKTDRANYIQDIEKFLALDFSGIDIEQLDNNALKSYRVLLPRVFRRRAQLVAYYLKKLGLYEFTKFFLKRRRKELYISPELINELREKYKTDYAKTLKLLNRLKVR